ncbi:YceD family protein [Thermogemmatispora onikobensis]|uniref:YceD family protein n=1 Tax=Thermogemmatispora onikobensis TaxID=732234 RepID=UPI00085382E6|nr:DUF177 domain-containing protein [Thermogemmatispora onikobensis]
MQYNVAQLLKASIGTAFQADIHEEDVQLDSDLKVLGAINGHVRMRRTDYGLLVDGWVDLILPMVCDRCLKPFEQPMHITFEELFYPTIDVTSGVPVPPPLGEDEGFPIDEHHHLDLSEAVRQHLLLELPMRALCREDCPGLCPQCGHDLSLGPCQCQPEIDPRWGTLAELLQQRLPSQA